MNRALILAAVLILALAYAPRRSGSTVVHDRQQATTQQSSASPTSPQQTGQPPVTPAPTLRTIVLDPGHGGDDTGARGPSGVAEKNVVLEFANSVATALRTEGFQVILTRTGDTDPSLSDRDAIGNAQSDAAFISLHVGSTGTVATVRTYTYLFPTQPAPPPANPDNAATADGPQAPPPGFLLWNEAQKPFVAQSVKLGDLLQVELAQKFKNSPEISASAPVAVLRSVAAPAVAVEVSSVAAGASQLESMSADLAACIARAAAAYKTVYVPEPH